LKIFDCENCVKNISSRYIEPIYEAYCVDKMWKTYPHFVWKTPLKIFDCENCVKNISSRYIDVIHASLFVDKMWKTYPHRL